MIITVEPEDGDDDSIQLHYKGVVEFAIVGTSLEGAILPVPFSHTHGDTFVIYGRLAELQERLRRFHDADSK